MKSIRERNPIQVKPFNCHLVTASSRVAARSAVVDEKVDGVRGNTGDNAIEGSRSNVVAKAVGALAETEEVRSKAGDMRASHGGTRDGLSATASPGALNIRTRSQDINGRANVGV